MHIYNNTYNVVQSVRKLAKESQRAVGPANARAGGHS